jgi:membrane-bound lytic murein transglycosylase MltF
MKRYFKDTKLIKNPLAQDVFGRVRELAPHFREAGSKNKFDWLMMMAQGYQESELNQSVRSPRGAVGIMQLLPGTARDVGFREISSARSNIAAGVSCMNFIRQEYFNEADISAEARVDFALAAYNSGPARIQFLRHIAKRRGLNPNIWFDNVERVALDKIGEEPVRYAANINRYYVAYRLSHQLDRHKAGPLAGEPGR